MILWKSAEPAQVNALVCASAPTDLALSVNTAQIRHEGTEACIGEE
jgi:hypothetical protein